MYALWTLPFPLWHKYKMIGKSESRNPGFLKTLWRTREWNHKWVLIAGDRNTALKRYFGS